MPVWTITTRLVFNFCLRHERYARVCFFISFFFSLFHVIRTYVTSSLLFTCSPIGISFNFYSPSGLSELVSVTDFEIWDTNLIRTRVLFNVGDDPAGRRKRKKKKKGGRETLCLELGLKNPSPTWSYYVHFVKSRHWIWECLEFHDFVAASKES